MIKKIYGQHTFYFSVLTIVLSIITLATGENVEFADELIVSFVCLFFILSVYTGIYLFRVMMEKCKAKKT